MRRCLDGLRLGWDGMLRGPRRRAGVMGDVRHTGIVVQMCGSVKGAHDLRIMVDSLVKTRFEEVPAL